MSKKPAGLAYPARADLRPTAGEVRDMRAKYDLTMAEAAHAVHVDQSAWSRWEDGKRRMSAAAWELFLMKLGEKP